MMRLRTCRPGMLAAAVNACFQRSSSSNVTAAFELGIEQATWIGESGTDLSDAASGIPPSARDSHGFTSAGGKLCVHGG